LTNVGADVAALSRIHVAYSGGPPSSADATGLAAALYVVFAATLAPYMHLSDALRGVEVTDLSSPTGGQGSHTQLTIGSLAGQPLPADVCLLASMTIGRRYRGGKPRSYLRLGDSNTVLTAQSWLAAFLANVQLSLNAIRADIAVTLVVTTQLTHMVNVSYYQGFTLVVNPITGRGRNVPKPRLVPVVDQVTNWTAETKFASQRRRNLRQP
jgi:hypothetical protein